jgi:hypothetical protein
MNLCKHCGKKFSRKIIFNRHIILCEILNNPKTKREIACEKEEEICVPSQEQMYNIILELAFKCHSLETKVDELQKQVHFKKPKIKIDILEWLNANITPIRSFSEWTNKLDFQVSDEDIEFLIESPQLLHELMNKIFGRIVELNYDAKNIAEYEYPLFCSSQKQKSFYIYLDEWQICNSEQIIYFIKVLHSKIFNACFMWNQKNKQALNNSDKLDDQYNTALMKVTGFKFLEESADMNKMKNSIYQHIKINLQEVNFS